MKLKWQQAPVKTQWGDEMVVASVAIDKDHTLSLYCEREQIAKVEVMFTSPQPAQQEPYGYVSTHTNGLMHFNKTFQGVYRDTATEIVAVYTSPPAQRKPLTDEPVRIYDYVWPQRDEHKEECVYACSYTPGHHLARGELLAVVHPSQLKNAYLQRDAEAAHGIKENK